MNEIVVAGLAFLGTVVGSLGGILASNKLINYRLKELELKVDKHNGVIERVFKLEGRMNEVEHDIRDLKK